MLLLQEYSKDKPEFDNNAYIISSVYHDGTLKMFTSHPLKSATSDRPEYLMTQLNTWGMTGNIETFREGATWYRNGRDWAKEQRDEAIKRANERATNNLGVSSTLNASFSTVCETSDNESAASITEQSYFSFKATDTTEESLRSDSPKRSRGKQDD